MHRPDQQKPSVVIPVDQVLLAAIPNLNYWWDEMENWWWSQCHRRENPQEKHFIMFEECFKGNYLLFSCNWTVLSTVKALWNAQRINLRRKKQLSSQSLQKKHTKTFWNNLNCKMQEFYCSHNYTFNLAFTSLSKRICR